MRQQLALLDEFSYSSSSSSSFSLPFDDLLGAAAIAAAAAAASAHQGMLQQRQQEEEQQQEQNDIQSTRTNSSGGTDHYHRGFGAYSEATSGRLRLRGAATALAEAQPAVVARVLTMELWRATLRLGVTGGTEVDDSEDESGAEGAEGDDADDDGNGDGGNEDMGSEFSGVAQEPEALHMNEDEDKGAVHAHNRRMQQRHMYGDRIGNNGAQSDNTRRTGFFSS